MNPRCENTFPASCQQTTEDASETRLFPKVEGGGFKFLCETCFEAEKQYWSQSGLYSIFNPAPSWDTAKVFTKLNE